jgi:hypothetical protein
LVSTCAAIALLATKHGVPGDQFSKPMWRYFAADLNNSTAPFMAQLQRVFRMATLQISHITVEEFNICATDSDAFNLNEKIVLADCGLCNINHRANFGAGNYKSSHCYLYLM